MGEDQSPVRTSSSGVSRYMYSTWRELTQRSLITESCRLSGVGSLVKDLPTKGPRADAKTKHSQTNSISDSEAAGHTNSLNARGETLRPPTGGTFLRNENPAALAHGSVKSDPPGRARPPRRGGSSQPRSRGR